MTFGRVPPRAVGRQRLLAEDVEDRAGEAAAAQRLEQRRLVDERAARDVDEPRPRRQRGDDLGAPMMPRDASVSGMVRTRTSASRTASRERRRRRRSARGSSRPGRPCPARGTTMSRAVVRARLDRDDPHPERRQLAGDLAADRAVARRSPPSCRGRPSMRRLVVGPAMGGLVGGPGGRRLVDAQDHPADVLGDRDGVDAPGVGDEDALPPRRVGGEVVDAGRADLEPAQPRHAATGRPARATR